jgi:hypothetical protein
MSNDFQWTTWYYIRDDKTLHNHALGTSNHMQCVTLQKTLTATESHIISRSVRLSRTTQWLRWQSGGAQTTRRHNSEVHNTSLHFRGNLRPEERRFISLMCVFRVRLSDQRIYMCAALPVPYITVDVSPSLRSKFHYVTWNELKADMKNDTAS